MNFLMAAAFSNKLHVASFNFSVTSVREASKSKASSASCTTTRATRLRQYVSRTRGARVARGDGWFHLIRFHKALISWFHCGGRVAQAGPIRMIRRNLIQFAHDAPLMWTQPPFLKPSPTRQQLSSPQNLVGSPTGLYAPRHLT